MGLLNSLHGDRIYLDVNVWIYGLEGYPDFLVDLTALFQAIEQGRLTAVTSELSLAEALVKPMKDQNLAAQAIYQQAISDRDHVEVLPVDRKILIQSAQLRTTNKLKLPDAIHLATAISSNCSTFLTNDKGFCTAKQLPVVILSDSNSKFGMG